MQLDLIIHHAYVKITPKLLVKTIVVQAVECAHSRFNQPV